MRMKDTRVHPTKVSPGGVWSTTRMFLGKRS
jgi:hypothetical protein